MIRVTTDAAVIGITGKAAAGIIILKDGEQKLLKKTFPKRMDNHEAELWAIEYALAYLLEAEFQEETIFLSSDSKFAITAIEKNYSKQSAYQEALQSIHTLKNHFDQLYLKWIPEKENRGADRLARQALRQSED